MKRETVTSNTYFKALGGVNWWPVVLLVGFMFAGLAGGGYVFEMRATTAQPAEPAKRSEIRMEPMMPVPVEQENDSLDIIDQNSNDDPHEGPNFTEIVRQINEARRASGVPAVREDTLLDKSSTLKVQDMIARNYWSHSAPDGSGPWATIKGVGYPYSYVGENLAYGQYPSSPETTIVQNWLKSSGHRKNMLNPQFKDIGIAVQKAKSYNGRQNVYVIVTQYGTRR